MLYERVLRPALFHLSGDDPERAHEWAMRLLAAASHQPLLPLARTLTPSCADPRLRQRLFGLTFPNPVGVAAGFDKDAVALHALAALGFGFIEAGTITFHAQEGNPRPRLVRLPERRALINRMGFNNTGALAVSQRLARAGRPSVPLGISLGKSRVAPLERAVEDYRASFRLLAPHADYIAVNVSSPNTPGLRALQEREAIDGLLAALQAEAHTLAARTGRPPVPLVVKVSPDLSFDALDELLAVCLDRGVAGVIAVNTTTALSPRPPPLAGEGVHGRSLVPQPDGATAPTHALAPDVWRGTPSPARGGGRGERSILAGGLSGRPLFPRAIEVVRHIRREAGGALPVIGVGGIFTAADAHAMLRAGARLVQVYTGLIYEGPAIARRINRGLVRLMERDGLTTIEELSGDRH